MPQNIFKIYDGRTNFWQWDTNQKLIVLDETITEVHFSNRDMNHSIPREVYTKEGIKMCDIPDVILQLPRNLIAYACVDGATVKSVKFAVLKRPVPDNYVIEQEKDIEEKLTEIDIKIDSLNENKADNIYYDEETHSIQLVANEKLIGNRVELPNDASGIITDCKIDENGYLVVTLSDGRTINAGYVGGVDGVTFIPHISEDLILTWENDGGLKNPDPVDLNPFDEWTTLPEEGVESEYEWEYM